MDGNTTATMFAHCNENARYPDGSYEAKAYVTDVRGNIDSSEVSEFVIDNYKPYIKSIEIRIGDDFVYEMEWECEGEQIVAFGGISPSWCPNTANMGEVSVIVKTSEPIVNEELGIMIEVDSDFNSEQPIRAMMDPLDDTSTWFSFTSDLANNLRNGDFLSFVFKGNDHTDLNSPNQLLNLEDFFDQVTQASNFVTIPTRIAAGQWLNPDNIPLNAGERLHAIEIPCILFDCNAPDSLGGVPSSRYINNPFTVTIYDVGEHPDIQKTKGGILVDINNDYGSPFSFNWEGPDGYSSQQQNIVNIEAGKYYCSVTSDQYCDTLTFNAVVNPYPECIDSELEFVEKNIYGVTCDTCTNGSIYYSHFSSGYTYYRKIINSSGDIVAERNGPPNVISAEGLAAGLYTIEIMVKKGNVLICTYKETVSICIPPANLKIVKVDSECGKDNGKLKLSATRETGVIEAPTNLVFRVSGLNGRMKTEPYAYSILWESEDLEPGAYGAPDQERIKICLQDVQPYMIIGETENAMICDDWCVNYSFSIEEEIVPDFVPKFSLWYGCDVPLQEQFADIWLEFAEGTETILDYNDFEYKWSNGKTTKDIHRVNRNECYTCEISLEGGVGDDCFTSVNICPSDSIEDCTPSLVLNEGFNTGVKCNDESKLELLVSIDNNDLLPLSYKWNTGEATATIHPLDTGTYCVTVTDAFCCEQDTCFEFGFADDFEEIDFEVETFCGRWDNNNGHSGVSGTLVFTFKDSIPNCELVSAINLLGNDVLHTSGLEILENKIILSRLSTHESNKTLVITFENNCMSKSVPIDITTCVNCSGGAFDWDPDVVIDCDEPVGRTYLFYSGFVPPIQWELWNSEGNYYSGEEVESGGTFQFTSYVPGDITVYFRGGDGCNYVTSGQIKSEKKDLFLNIDVVNECIDVQNGSIIIDFSNRWKYKIEWDNGEENFEIDNLTAGYYEYTISKKLSNCDWRGGVNVNTAEKWLSYPTPEQIADGHGMCDLNYFCDGDLVKPIVVDEDAEYLDLGNDCKNVVFNCSHDDGPGPGDYLVIGVLNQSNCDYYEICTATAEKILTDPGVKKTIFVSEIREEDDCIFCFAVEICTYTSGREDTIISATKALEKVINDDGKAQWTCDCDCAALEPELIGEPVDNEDDLIDDCIMGWNDTLFFSSPDEPSLTECFDLHYGEITNPDCIELDNGVIEYVVDTVENYTFYWEDIANNLWGVIPLNIYYRDDLEAGVYYVEIRDKDDFDCVFYDTITLGYFDLPELLDVEFEKSSCGGSDGGIYLEFEFWNSDLDIEWFAQDGQNVGNELDLEDIPAGFYYYIISNNLFQNCELQGNLIELVELEGCCELPDLLDIDIEIPSCGISNGAINPEFEFWNLDMDIEWFNLEGENVGDDLELVNVPSGFYYFNISNSNSQGCEEEGDIIELPGSVNTNYVVVDDNPCNPFLQDIGNGSIVFEETGYYYNWEYTWENTHELYNLPSGLYAVSITNEYGCQEFLSITVLCVPPSSQSYQVEEHEIKVEEPMKLTDSLNLIIDEKYKEKRWPQVSIYPNPTSNKFNFMVKNPFQRQMFTITVIDVLGREISSEYRWFGSGITFFEYITEKWKNGVYFISMKNEIGETVLNEKLVIEK